MGNSSQIMICHRSESQHGGHTVKCNEAETIQQIHELPVIVSRDLFRKKGLFIL
jgi:hypothetical protein